MTLPNFTKSSLFGTYALQSLEEKQILCTMWKVIMSAFWEVQEDAYHLRDRLDVRDSRVDI